MRLILLLAILALPLTASAGIQPFSHQTSAPAIATTQAAVLEQTEPLPTKHRIDDTGKTSGLLSAFGTTLCHLPRLLGIADVRLGSVTVSPTGIAWVLPTIDLTPSAPGAKTLTLPTIPVK